MRFLGTRRGETIALTRKDVCFDSKTILVNKAISHENGKAELTTTKAEKLHTDAYDDGSRIVPIPDILLPVLENHCKDLKPDDLLFPKEDGGYATDCACRRWWDSVIRQCHITAGAETYLYPILCLGKSGKRRDAGMDTPLK